MLFELKVAYSCPVAKRSKGRVRLHTPVIQEIVRTLMDEKDWEWGIGLLGTADPTGIDVVVEDFVVLPQTREQAEVAFDEIDMIPRLVAGLHSHNEMEPVFSTIDHKNINKQFPLSIVVGSKLVGRSPQEKWMGFGYQAEGRVIGPCGDLLVVPFVVEPFEIVEGYPYLAEKDFGIADHLKIERADLSDCTQIKVTEDEPLYNRIFTSCGIEALTRQPKAYIFGMGPGEITKQLPPPTVKVHKYGQYWSQNGNVHTYTPPKNNTGDQQAWGNALGGLSNGDLAPVTNLTSADDDWEQYREYEIEWFNEEDAKAYALATKEGKKRLMDTWLAEYYKPRKDIKKLIPADMVPVDQLSDDELAYYQLWEELDKRYASANEVRHTAV